ncbi:unnamed protein product, partial [Prorocentrum cordatum]
TRLPPQPFGTKGTRRAPIAQSMADARQAELLGLVEETTAASPARGPWRGLQLGAAALLLLGALTGAAHLALGAEAPHPRATGALLELTASEGDTSALLELDDTQQAVVNKLIDRQVALAQTGAATSSPTRSDFEELGGTLPVAADRALKSLDSSAKRKLTGPRVGYLSPFPEEMERTATTQRVPRSPASRGTTAATRCRL